MQGLFRKSQCFQASLSPYVYSKRPFKCLPIRLISLIRFLYWSFITLNFDIFIYFDVVEFWSSMVVPTNLRQYIVFNNSFQINGFLKLKDSHITVKQLHVYSEGLKWNFGSCGDLGHKPSLILMHIFLNFSWTLSTTEEPSWPSGHFQQNILDQDDSFPWATQDPSFGNPNL